MAINLKKIIPTANILGECVLWDENSELVWWTDIESQLLFSLEYSTEILKIYDLPERLGSFAMIQNSSKFLAAFESGLAIYDPSTQTVDWLETIYKKACGIRLNDGRVDREGRFWVGAMVEEEKKTSALSRSKLFRYSGNKILSVQQTNIQISNSICFSPDGKVLYFSDSPKNQIYAYDLCSDTGNISNKRVFARTNSGVHPDGSCVDSDGCVWNAQWGAGQVVRYTPMGEIDYVLDVPSLQPTCVSFGGPNLDHLLITSARIGMSEQEKIECPSSGALFIYETPYRGLLENRFKQSC